MSPGIHQRISAPGITLLIRGIPAFALPIVLSYGALSILQKFIDVSFSVRSRLAICTISLPVYFLSRFLWNETKIKRSARLLDADEVPVLKGKLPGNLDIVREWDQSFSDKSQIGTYHI